MSLRVPVIILNDLFSLKLIFVIFFIRVLLLNLLNYFFVFPVLFVRNLFLKLNLLLSLLPFHLLSKVYFFVLVFIFGNSHHIYIQNFNIIKYSFKPRFNNMIRDTSQPHKWLLLFRHSNSVFHYNKIKELTKFHGHYLDVTLLNFKVFPW